MAFTTALSGVNAAQSDLDVISNNIANSSTTGFKTAVQNLATFTHKAFWARPHRLPARALR